MRGRLIGFIFQSFNLIHFKTAVENGNFKTLAAALKAADLIEPLQGKGPFTVFAPTDAAFAKLPKGTVEHLMKKENRADLKTILTYHVVPGKVLAKEVHDSLVSGDSSGQDASTASLIEHLHKTSR